MVRALLENAKSLSLLDKVVSADEMKTLKPDPALYAHAMRRLKHGDGAFWLVSSNPFDIIGAKTAGLRTAWVRRNAAVMFDPWSVEPDLVVPGLDQRRTVLEARFDRGVTKSGFPRGAFEGVLVDVQRFDFGFQGGGLESEFDRGA